MQEKSIFTRIIEGKIPCHKVYEDEKVFAMLDIEPLFWLFKKNKLICFGI